MHTSKRYRKNYEPHSQWQPAHYKREQVSTEKCHNNNQVKSVTTGQGECCQDYV